MEKKSAIYLIFVAFILLKGTYTYATVYEGACGEQVNWTFDDETKVLRIDGTGPMTGYSFNTYKDVAKRIEIGEGVTSIVSSAFYYFGAVDTILCANTVDSVGSGAFGECTSLLYCDLGRGVRFIGSGAFSNCKALRKVKWSECLETIENIIFSNYNANGDLPVYLEDTLYFPATFTSNKSVVWWRTPNLDAVVWNARHPKDPTSEWNSPLNIGSGYGYSFKRILFGPDVEYIPNYLCAAYRGDSVILPEGLKEIGKYAFQNCNYMTYLSLPSTLSRMGANAFEGCNKLKQVVLPENLTEISAGLFYNCTDLGSVRIPQNVTSIGENAFSSITGSDSLVIPDKVISIGTNAFENWAELKELSIGKNVVLIGDNAFKGDSAVTHITVWAATPPSVSEGTLADIPDSAWLSVLPDSRKLYREHPYWGRFRMSEVPDSSMIQRNVTIDPGETTANFTWPTDSAAHSYQIDIYKDGAVFCKLKLGPKGQLAGIAFSAPSRKIGQIVNDQIVNDLPYTLSFMVTGLDVASRYNYVLSALDGNQAPIHVYIGDFATLGYEGDLKGGGDEVIPTPPVIPYNPEPNPETGVDKVSGNKDPNTKVIRDGRLYFIGPDGSYDIIGKRIE